jgi:hypothetical protein
LASTGIDRPFALAERCSTGRAGARASARAGSFFVALPAALVVVLFAFAVVVFFITMSHLFGTRCPCARLSHRHPAQQRRRD